MRANFLAIGLMGLLITSSPTKAGDNVMGVHLASLSKVLVTKNAVNSITSGDPAPAPLGFVSFCLRFADQCDAPRNGPSAVNLSIDVEHVLNQVNQAVNQAIVPMDDLHHYGIAEYWNIPTDGFGDCEDYALTKRRALIKAGFPMRALRIAIVETTANQRHAVLTVVTDQGDYVLDNLTDAIRLWTDTDYIWTEWQDSSGPSGWVSLSTPQRSAASAHG